ncbi:MAG: hypothetical protein QNJ54_27705 [Prochloraceae cyanobacterium]|nr:hypothetical protein [Prochloraceae cyanobacterium]
MSQDIPVPEGKSIETLHGLVLTETTATIKVTSTGCTAKEDFQLRLQKSEPPILTIIRVKPDLCLAAPHTIDIVFSLKEIGATNFTVANLFAPGSSLIQGEKPMLNKIKAVLKDTQVRQELQEAKTPDDVIKLLTTAGSQKGYNFKAEDVSKFLTGLALQTVPELSEEDLLNRAGGELRARGTWPISAGVCCVVL